MLGLVSRTTLNEAVRTLIDGMDQQLDQRGKSPARKSSPDKKAVDKTAESALKNLYQGAATFCSSHRLGIVGRARLAQALQTELRARGYGAELVSKVTMAVVTNALVVSAKDHLT